MIAAGPFRRVADLEGSGDSSLETIERPRLCVEAELIARFLRVVAPFSILMLGVALVSTAVTWVRRVGFLSRGGEISIASGDGARSLIGLTSSGRGRAGDVGDSGMLKRGVLFHGVEDPGVSIDNRGRDPRDSE